MLSIGKLLKISWLKNWNFGLQLGVVNYAVSYQREAGGCMGELRDLFPDTNLNNGWLSEKVNRRETKEELLKERLTEREMRANQAAEDYLGHLSRRAKLRDGLRERGEDYRRMQQEILEEKARQFREQLRKKLPDTLRDDH